MYIYSVYIPYKLLITYYYHRLLLLLAALQKISYMQHLK